MRKIELQFFTIEMGLQIVRDDEAVDLLDP